MPGVWSPPPVGECWVGQDFPLARGQGDRPTSSSGPGKSSRLTVRPPGSAGPPLCEPGTWAPPPGPHPFSVRPAMKIGQVSEGAVAPSLGTRSGESPRLFVAPGPSPVVAGSAPGPSPAVAMVPATAEGRFVSNRVTAAEGAFALAPVMGPRTGCLPRSAPRPSPRAIVSVPGPLPRAVAAPADAADAIVNDAVASSAMDPDVQKTLYLRREPLVGTAAADARAAIDSEHRKPRKRVPDFESAAAREDFMLQAEVEALLPLLPRVSVIAMLGGHRGLAQMSTADRRPDVLMPL